MKAVHFGAGNIGRGFIGSLLYKSGFSTTFVDVNQEIVDLLNEKQEYRVVLAELTTDEHVVQKVKAVHSQLHPEQVIEEIVQADLITTAVGPQILPLISDLLYQGLKQRAVSNSKPLAIISCENMIGGSAFLQEKVYEKLQVGEQEQFDRLFHFPNAAVDRIVPLQSNADKLMVMVEPFFEWIVEGGQAVDVIPHVEGLQLVHDLTPYIERKLFTVNTGHAIAAYLGYKAGIETINEAMQNEEILAIVEAALKESGNVLIEKYNFDENEHRAYIAKIIERFLNPYISDEVTRVGRSPLRKLGANDRLISPAKQYVELLQKEPEHLAKGIAAALHYNYAEDPEAVELQKEIQTNGVELALPKFTGLPKESALVELILKHYHV
ncbi:mannitol-1-phosphate 5-dehydrogenase [Bacillus horti]|uniref:Mannitol-1-phosphate 5-dehydrogenase n=1 Tax=Caldalkalibacillus horti TaxID=77523 RepID=A0ABT9W3C8_9BACI|nr:mannitol-1-phosphate 5-dehydrogenase [Bacillus horti]MDQ0167752.1 mannitol-1-phosphate 5-dehydrogenase [Bacillus horti]